MDRKMLFKKIYKHNEFQGKEQVSGRGSDSDQTKVLIPEITKLIIDLNIQSIVDAPCGSFVWMKEVLSHSKVKNYIGVDIVDDLVNKLHSQYLGKYQFYCLDIVDNILPKVDLIICRDCLVHMSFEDAVKTLNNLVKSKSNYFLMTTFINDDRVNLNFKYDVNWYPMSLEKFPFCLPKPIRIINENCTECNNEYTDKCLGLWTLQQLEEVCGNWEKSLE